MTKHERTIREIGCIVCRLEGRGYVPAAVHHCRFPVGMGQRASQWYAIPLAPPIHQLGFLTPEWPWQDDVPIHAGHRPFAARYGVGERELLWETWQRLPYRPDDDDLIRLLDLIGRDRGDR